MYYSQYLQNSTFITIALDLMLTANKGYFTGKHSYKDAFFFNNKMDNVPYFSSDKPTVVNAGELIKKIADGN